MKYIPKIQIEFDTIIGRKVNLTVTMIIMEETAKLIVCDARNKIDNLVCAMNLY